MVSRSGPLVNTGLAGPSADESTSKNAREWTSEQLFGRAQQIEIRHEGQLYRLRRTKLGKLILTK